MEKWKTYAIESLLLSCLLLDMHFPISCTVLIEIAPLFLSLKQHQPKVQLRADAVFYCVSVYCT
jgi:hypothetical protein